MTNDEIAKLTLREHRLTIGPARPVANSPARRRPNPGNRSRTTQPRGPGLSHQVPTAARSAARTADLGPPEPGMHLAKFGAIPTIPPRTARSGREKSAPRKVLSKNLNG